MERVSFKETIDALCKYSNAISQARNKKLRAQLWQDLLLNLSRDLLPDRPGRLETRSLKRRQKNFGWLTKPCWKFPEVLRRNRHWRPLFRRPLDSKVYRAFTDAMGYRGAMRGKPAHLTARRSLKVRAAVSFLAVLVATVGCNASANDDSDATNSVPQWWEAQLRVALTNVHPLSTARASTLYRFAIKKVLPLGSPAMAKDPYSQRIMQFILWEGADQDDKKRDSIARLTEFFGLPAPGLGFSEIPMALEDTNVVTVRMFSRGGMLFEDDRGNRAAISTSPGDAWASRVLWEQFGGWRSDEEKSNSVSDATLRQRLIGVWSAAPNATTTILGNGTFIDGYTNAKVAGAYEGLWILTNGFVVWRTTNHLDERYGAWWRPAFDRWKILRIDDREFFALTESPFTNHMFRYRPDLKW